MTTPTPGQAWIPEPPESEPYAHGLLSAAQITEGPGQWQKAGVEYFTDRCAQGGHVRGSCPRPQPGGERPASVTAASAAAGAGFRIVPLDDSTTGFAVIGDTGLPATLHLELAAGALLQFTVDPGQRVDFPNGGPGTFRVSGAGCEVTFTAPFAAGTPLLGECNTAALPVTLSNAGASQSPVRYEVTGEGGRGRAEGTLLPGENATHLVMAGNATVRYLTPGGEEITTAPVTVPGTPVTTSLAVPFDPASSHHKPEAGGLTLVTGSDLITVYTRAECNALGFEDPQGLALARLALVEERELERAFSELVLGAAGERTPLGDTAVSLARAVGVLEQDAALHYAGRPTFHAPRWVQPYFSALRLLRPADGRVLRTVLGSPIVFGGGYWDDPHAPGTVDPTTVRLFVTGPVRAHRAEPFVHEVMAPAQNRRMALAERSYALDHDCYRASARAILEG